MLEKIGLPPKPSLRGSNWVVDASHCQGCSSQFTFINRKHHCRRCGGLFCNSCTQQRMVLRGQGDSPVRICEPCKKLEEAARFEMRHGYRNRAGRGSSKLTPKQEDEVLNQILDTDANESISSLQHSSIQRATSASCSNVEDLATHDGAGEIWRSRSVDEPNHADSEIGSASPEELRQQALEEKKKYKILKGEGKSEQAMRAFKIGKELERQADALEISIRKKRRKVLSSGSSAEIQDKDGPKESGRKNKLPPQVGKEKDDLTAELRELGWSDMDLRNDAKKSAALSLEGELSSLLGDISQGSKKGMETLGIEKTQVAAHKKRALTLKREGKLVEAKEELKKAKVLEKKLEEQELLAGAEDSDDEISALIRSMDDDKQDELLISYEQGYRFDFDHLLSTGDDIGVGHFDVTDEDMEDPEIAAALKSFGWTDDSSPPVKPVPQLDREVLSSEILSLKREALNLKRAGNVAEAMAQLKKAKLLERDLETFGSQADNVIAHKPATTQKGSAFQMADKTANSNPVPKNRMMIQKELLALKKRALSLRREGRLDEAEEELKKGRVLEHQLEEMDNAMKVVDPQLTYEHPDISRMPDVPVGEEGEEDVTDQDMHDPTYLSLLQNLGWNDEDSEHTNCPSKLSKQDDKLSVPITESSGIHAASNISTGASRSKAEIQRELLGLKRKALALRRQGKTDEAEEVLTTAKALEAQIAELEMPKKEGWLESDESKGKVIEPSLKSEVKEGDEDNVTEKHMYDPTLLSMLKNLEGKEEEVGSLTMQRSPKRVVGTSAQSSEQSVTQSSYSVPVVAPRNKAEFQRELLGLKRNALALRRKGETEEAEQLFNRASALEAQMKEMEAPKEDFLLHNSKEMKSGSLESFINHENQGNLKDLAAVTKETVVIAVGPNNKVAKSEMALGRMESDSARPPLRNVDDLIPVKSKLIEESPTLLRDSRPLDVIGIPGNVGADRGIGFIPSPGQSANIMGLLAGDDYRSCQMPAEIPADKGYFGSEISSLAGPPVQLGSLRTSHDGLERKENVTTERRQPVLADDETHIYETASVQEYSSQKNQNLLRQEILDRKKKAVALKREGKLAEAREELRQAKLLEKRMEEDQSPQVKAGSHDGSVSTPSFQSVVQKANASSNLTPKPLSGRDRFKLQQESLSHKRQALKLRREGRTEEAEAEFELAKALEAQLEELDGGAKPSATGALVDDVVVEDLLDPQLLSALKAIGMEDASNVSRGPEKPEPVKINPVKSERLSHERDQLEERIKAEKVKAVNLKRSGKQAEALDALRQAKLLEKKLNSLVSN